MVEVSEFLKMKLDEFGEHNYLNLYKRVSRVARWASWPRVTDLRETEILSLAGVTLSVASEEWQQAEGSLRNRERPH